MIPPIILIDRISKVFPARRWFGPRAGIIALSDISFSLRPGEILGILGPNGSGKTTLLEILATYLLPTSGCGTVNGHDLARDPLAVRRSVGYCPAGAAGFDLRLQGRMNLEFFALLAGMTPRQGRERVSLLFELVGLSRRRDVPVSRYSDGMRQRLALARALLSDPPVLLLDEPGRALDPEARAFWASFLREHLAGELGKAVVLVTHNLEEAESVCDHVALLRSGRIELEGRAGAVLAGQRDCLSAPLSAAMGGA